MLVLVALAACAPTAPPAAPSPTATSASPTPTPAPTPEVPIASSVVISLDTLTVLDQHGQELKSASFDDDAAIVALVTELVGSQPQIIDNRKFGMWYQWPETEVRSAWFTWMIIDKPTLGGLPLSTSSGIHVGSSRAEVEAAGAVSLDEGDGPPSNFALDARPNPEFHNPAGEDGTDYIYVGVVDDVVVKILAPWGDWPEI